LGYACFFIINSANTKPMTMIVNRRSMITVMKYCQIASVVSLTRKNSQQLICSKHLIQKEGYVYYEFTCDVGYPIEV